MKDFVCRYYIIIITISIISTLIVTALLISSITVLKFRPQVFKRRITQLVLLILIYGMVIYLLDSAIQRVNNQDQNIFPTLWSFSAIIKERG